MIKLGNYYPCFGDICAELRHTQCVLLSNAAYPMRTNSQERTSGVRTPLLQFTLAELNKMTRNFSESHKIGEGYFGTIYQGKLRDGTTVAIERAKKAADGLNETFQAEVDIFSQVEHVNVVMLMGFLQKKNERILVTEYVANGNFRQHLDGYGVILDMNKRLNIAIDVAGLHPGA